MVFPVNLSLDCFCQLGDPLLRLNFLLALSFLLLPLSFLLLFSENYMKLLSGKPA